MAILKGLLALVLVLAICAEVSLAKRSKSRTLPAVLPLSNRVAKSNVERDFYFAENPPSLFADHRTIHEDESASCFNVLKNDFDIDDDLVESSIEISQGASHGFAEIDDENRICYQAFEDFNGEDTVTYRVCDETNLCSEALLRITVLPINDKPTAVNDDAYVGEDEYEVNIDVLLNDHDVDGFVPDYKTLKVVKPACNGITVVNADHTITYTPEFSDEVRFYGEDTFVYQICDIADPTLCSYATVTVTVEDKCLACIRCNDYIPTFNLHRKWLDGYYHTEVLGFSSK